MTTRLKNYYIKIVSIKIFLLLCILTCAFLSFSQESQLLKPTINLNDIIKSTDYFGFEIKWKIEKKLVNNVSLKVILMDPEVFLSYVRYEAKNNNWTSEKTEKEGERILDLLEKYISFKIILEHDTNTDLLNINNLDFLLIDDLNNKYSPQKIEEDEIIFKRGWANPFYSRTYHIHFQRNNNKSSLITNETKFVSLRFKEDSKIQEFKWLFSEDLIKENEGSSLKYITLAKYFVVLVLFLLLFICFITTMFKKNNLSKFVIK